jgi:deoxyribodipyrimidine photolyase
MRFRRDLRLSDNPALLDAEERREPLDRYERITR